MLHEQRERSAEYLKRANEQVRYTLKKMPAAGLSWGFDETLVMISKNAFNSKRLSDALEALLGSYKSTSDKLSQLTFKRKNVLKHCHVQTAHIFVDKLSGLELAEAIIVPPRMLINTRGPILLVSLLEALRDTVCAGKSLKDWVNVMLAIFAVIVIVIQADAATANDALFCMIEEFLDTPGVLLWYEKCNVHVLMRTVGWLLRIHKLTPAFYSIGKLETPGGLRSPTACFTVLTYSHPFGNPASPGPRLKGKLKQRIGR